MIVQRNRYPFLPAFTFALLVLLYLCLFWSLLDCNGIWISDEGNRMLHIEAIAENHGLVRDPLNGEEIPRLTAYSPESYFVRRPDDHKLISAYTPAFPAAASLLYRQGGFPLVRSAVLFLAFCSMGMIWLTCRSLDFMPSRTALTLLLYAAGSPLLFYSGTMLEITTAAFLSTVFLYAMVRTFETNLYRWWFLGGIAAGLIPLFREEGYVLIIASAISLVLCRRRRRFCFIIPALLTLIPYLIWNKAHSGTVWGMHHAFYNDLAKSIPTMWEHLCSMDFFLLKPNTGGLPLVCSIRCIFYAVIACAFVKKQKIHTCILILLAMAAVADLFFLVHQPEPMESLLYFQSLCGTAAFVLVPILYTGKFWNAGERIWRFLFCMAYLGCAGVAFLLNYKLAGVFFGARHFTVFFGVLAVLLLHCMDFNRGKSIVAKGAKYAILALLLCACASQIYGYALLRIKKNWSKSLCHSCIDSKCQLIATDVFFISEELASLPKDKAVLFIGESGEKTFAGYLAQHPEINRFCLILNPHFSGTKNLPRILMQNGWFPVAEQECKDPHMNFMSVLVITWENGNGRTGKLNQPQ